MTASRPSLVNGLLKGAVNKSLPRGAHNPRTRGSRFSPGSSSARAHTIASARSGLPVGPPGLGGADHGPRPAFGAEPGHAAIRQHIADPAGESARDDAAGIAACARGGSTHHHPRQRHRRMRATSSMSARGHSAPSSPRSFSRPAPAVEPGAGATVGQPPTKSSGRFGVSCIRQADDRVVRGSSSSAAGSARRCGTIARGARLFDPK